MSSESVTLSNVFPENSASELIPIPIEDGGKHMEKNPFRMPSDVDFFVFRDQEKEKRQAELEVQKSLKIHEKTTLMKAKLGGVRKEAHKENREEDESSRSKETRQDTESPDDSVWRLDVTKASPLEKESLLEYTKKKREMFLLQYALFVKRNEIQQMETTAVNEETKLEKAEQFLEEDASTFDEFLKENDRCSVDAIKIADKETKLKMDKVAEIRKLSAQVMSIKSDISRHEEILQEYILYQEFLFKLSPPEWQEKHKKKLKEVKSTQSSGKEKGHLEPKLTKSSSSGGRSVESRTSIHPLQRWDSASIRRSISKIMPSKRISESSYQMGRMQNDLRALPDEDEEPVLYFTDPQQLMKIFTELEEQNLSLIQNSQDTEEALEELKHDLVLAKERMAKETKQLNELISRITASIEAEEEKSAELQIKSRVFSFEQHSEEDQDIMLDALHKKVKEVYQSCLGDDQASLTTLQMLMYIENQMEDLLDRIELIPTEKLELAEKLKDKERRKRLREEKMRQQKIHQEERLRRALERAQADTKKTTGRRLIFRSDPPASKQKIEKEEEIAVKELEETNYFFN
uniref:Cilia- and flagella-associated protein 100 isoform X2 n=1 Tax=Geotrypetes seraphini TaxID=260995 RepID=A0A6P8Q3B9_GEOSA|nr:cilia- and flagella-associated protein 100 isoform X2 [Geotrypetes seraphini]